MLPCVPAHTCWLLCGCVCVVHVCFSTVLHASFARRRDAVESSLSARPAVLGVLGGPVPCRDPALPEPMSTRGVRTLICCAAPSLIPHTHALARARTRSRTRTSVRARAGASRHIGSAAPGRPSQLKRRWWTRAPLAHASVTRRAHAADVGPRGRYVSQPKGVGFSYCDNRRGGEVRE